MDKLIINLFNSNVYLTNLLLIPSLIFVILIIKNIKKHNDNENSSFYYSKWYYGIWIGILILMILLIIFSTIHHIVMFSDNILLRKIKKIDSHFTAPVFGLVLLLLIIYYGQFLKHKKKENNNITFPIFIISISYICIGFIVYVIRKLSRNKIIKIDRNMYKYIYMISHIFFHYMVYSGVILLFLLYYVENKDIYLTLFN